MREWYQNLKKQASISDFDDLTATREVYREAIRPIRNPKDWERWLNTWEETMTLSVFKKVPDVLNTAIWVDDFLRAVQLIDDQWAISYRLTQKQVIEQGKLDYRTLAKDFRNRMANRNIPSRPGRAAKGAFGPSYSSKEHQDTQEDAPMSDRKRPGRGKGKRAREQTISSSGSQRCLACDLYHPGICWYVYPENKPNWFLLNEEVVSLVQDRLREDPSIKEKLQHPEKRARRETPIKRDQTSSSRGTPVGDPSNEQ